MNLHKKSGEIKERWDRFFESVGKPLCCLFCKGERIYWNGHRERSASVMEGDRVVYLSDVLCRRVKCGNPSCRKSWTLRPPGLMPRRHYQLCVVASATRGFLFQPQSTLTSVAAAHLCYRRSVERWLYWIAGIAKPSALSWRLRIVSKKDSLALRWEKLKGLWQDMPRKGFQLAATNFSLLEALAAAYGYEPPSFQGLIETIIGNRDRVTTYRAPPIPELAR